MDPNAQNAREALRDLMIDISDRHWAAGWMMDLEYNLWDAVLRGPKQYGDEVIAREDIEALTRLSEKTNGWFWWSKEAEEEQFIPLDEWKQHYADWVVRQEQSQK
jgi:hypothetical protein